MSDQAPPDTTAEPTFAGGLPDWLWAILPGDAEDPFLGVLALLFFALLALDWIGNQLKIARGVVSFLHGMVTAPGPTLRRRFNPDQVATSRELDAAKQELLDRIEARFAAQSERPVPPDEAEKKAEAAKDLVDDTRSPAREAAEAVAAGDFTRAFNILTDDAEAGEAEAADRWRRLGALARGVDTMKAREAYEKAFALQPDDFWTCIELSRLRQEAGRTTQALEAAEHAERAARTERDRAAAHSEMGNKLATTGDASGALDRYRESLTLAEALSDSNPKSSAAKRDLSVSLQKVGNMLSATGDASGALDRYRESLRLAEALSASNPGSAAAKRDLSVNLNKVGDMLSATGDAAGALAHYREGLTLAEALSESNPKSSAAKRDLSVSLQKVGNMLSATGDASGALDRYRESLRLAEALSASNPGSAEAKRDVSVSLNHVGDMLSATGDASGALARYRESLTLREEMAALNPGSATAKRDVSVSLWKIADLAEDEVSWGRVRDALEAMDAAGTLLPTDRGALEEARRRAGEV